MPKSLDELKSKIETILSADLAYAKSIAEEMLPSILGKIEAILEGNQSRSVATRVTSLVVNPLSLCGWSNMMYEKESALDLALYANELRALLGETFRVELSTYTGRQVLVSW